MKLYVIYDSKAEESGSIQMCKNDNVACRMFGNALAGEIKNGLDPSDFSLYCVGTYNPDTMELNAIKPTLVPFDLKGDIEG